MPNYHVNKKKQKQHRKKKENDKNNNVITDTSSDNSSVRSSKTDDSGRHSEEIKEELPYMVKFSDIMGRYLAASRDLKPGDLIINEPPLVIGPCADTIYICLGCYIELVPDLSTNYKCPGCGWALCSPKCSGLKKTNGHSVYECTALREHRVVDFLDKCDDNDKRQMYEVLVALRCLLLKANNKEAWENLLKMESHNEIRRKIPALWQRNQECFVNRIRNDWKFEEFSEDEIHTICGILEVNSFEVGQNGSRARALYSNAFLLAHDCTPNTTHTDHPLTHMMTIRMTVPVKKGDMITLSYSYTLQGSLKRRNHLHECKFFWCQCARCADPTEFQTYSSALLCPKCNGGFIMDAEPLNCDSKWKCNKCTYAVTGNSMLLLVDKLFNELDAIDVNDIDQYEEFLTKYRNVLHPNHYLFLSAKHSLCQLYGRSEHFLIQNMSIEKLKLKEKYCRDLLKVIDKFEPGLSRLRGVIIYELHAPIMIQATREFERKTIDTKEFKTRLKEVIQLLTESEKILSFEPEGSPEYQMAVAAKDALRRIAIR